MFRGDFPYLMWPQADTHFISSDKNNLSVYICFRLIRQRLVVITESSVVDVTHFATYYYRLEFRLFIDG